ncbi:MAG: 50S ribosomal protein L3 [Thaumarchaeota archaeon]|nr:50S ribosomal protein L3 [Nitrososphaerota archaeon]
MGHRKHSSPRRGSLAFIPRARRQKLIPRVRTWPTISSDKPTILGIPTFKAGSIHVMTSDDREKTPNFGKPLFNASTVLATVPITIIGFRAYLKGYDGLQPFTDVFAENLPKELERKFKMNTKGSEEKIKPITDNLSNIKQVSALVSVTPEDALLSQKKPFIFEVIIGGGDIKSQVEYAKSMLGKSIKASDVFKAGMMVDVIGVTKGKGFEGPVTRMGIKRKQHKSRKSVRAVGVLNPWHPSTIMYTVPRAGQMGFHQRMDRNKRILAIANAKDQPITPAGGFLHYGNVQNDYLIVKGSVPGPIKRLVTLKLPSRHVKVKAEPPKILQISTVPKR